MKATSRILTVLLAIAGGTQAFGALTTFQTFTGANYGVSTSGFGSLSGGGSILTSVPVGATLVAAYLYTGFNDGITPTATLNSTAVSFGPTVLNTTACCRIGSARADVTSIVQAALTLAGGPSATPFSLTLTEGDSLNQDGEMLVSVYQFATGANNAVFILDGFASVAGDTATISLAAPATALTTAEMLIGDNFSCCDQKSTITVNGTTITENAGNFDDCNQAFAADGCLITVGTNLNNGDLAFSDPFSTLLPTYANDRERYNLTPYITVGDTIISITTSNGTEDDNIFAAVFKVTGDGSIVTTGDPVPEPGTLLMLATGFIGIGINRLRKRNA